MSYKEIIIATGGTGGHIFPAYSLARYFIKNGSSVNIITDNSHWEPIGIMPLIVVSTAVEFSRCDVNSTLSIFFFPSSLMFVYIYMYIFFHTDTILYIKYSVYVYLCVCVCVCVHFVIVFLSI